MATVIDEVKARGRYNWAAWANGNAYRLERGSNGDFEIPAPQMARRCHRWASLHGLKVTTRTRGHDTLEVRFFEA